MSGYFMFLGTEELPGFFGTSNPSDAEKMCRTAVFPIELRCPPSHKDCAKPLGYVQHVQKIVTELGGHFYESLELYFTIPTQNVEWTAIRFGPVFDGESGLLTHFIVVSH